MHSNIFRRAIASFSSDSTKDKYQVSPEDLAAGRNFFLGSDLDGIMDLSQNTFDIQIQSDIAGVQHNMFIYAHTLAQL
jgi:hypothetical protein